MSYKIAFIGAGSFGFTRTVVKDILTFRRLADAEIALMDIDPARLEMAKQCCQKLVDLGDYPAKITVTQDRKKALAGADAVIITILCGAVDTWQHDILIPKKYGVDICVGDTRGPSGVFRALRTIPTMLSICKDMEKLCPKAILLNYTNPMAMLCHAMQLKYPHLAISGLCHSVQGTAAQLAMWVGKKAEEVDYVCAGINHMAWYIKFESDGKNLYPQLREKILNDPKIYNNEQVRNEMFLALDYYPTESSGHHSEYNAWFRKRPDLIKKYCTKGTGWNPGEHAYILNEYRSREHTWKKELKEWLNLPDWNDPEKVKKHLQRGHEYASSIINAWTGGELFTFNGNVPNTGIITNMPQNACVEVPVLASRRRLQAMYVGELPKSVLSLTALSANNEMMAVEGALTGNAKMVYYSIANDPLTAAVLSLAEIKKMTKEMFDKNKPFLKYFKKVEL
jgi:alpha-galactosidase